ncbi:MAG TPA: response regulator, partial [Thermoanaerobaculia bacterium]
MPKRILLADDSITIQKVVELTFSDGDYEVTAVNNGAKAIQKLSEMRPDIILSDIIMPEKNGYEVCEHVKSHPEYRNIPVVLLTGTFEPFDPDRAEKAGCDAVVTKPFESQSLIHKVEELIAAAQAASASAAAAPAATPEPEPEAPSPWMDDEPAAATTEPSAAMPFTTSGGSLPAPPEAFTHDADIFNAAPVPAATTEMPFDATADSPFAGETRAFPRMSFDDFPPVPPPTAERSPWDEQDLGGETRAFGKINVEDLQSMQQPIEPEVTRDDPQPEPQFGAPDSQFAAPDSQFAAPDSQFAAPDADFATSGFDAPEPQYGAPEP